MISIFCVCSMFPYIFECHSCVFRNFPFVIHFLCVVSRLIIIIFLQGQLYRLKITLREFFKFEFYRFVQCIVNYFLHLLRFYAFGPAQTKCKSLNNIFDLPEYACIVKKSICLIECNLF